jgi:hypothetical protein
VAARAAGWVRQREKAVLAVVAASAAMFFVGLAMGGGDAPSAASPAPGPTDREAALEARAEQLDSFERSLDGRRSTLNVRENSLRKREIAVEQAEAALMEAAAAEVGAEADTPPAAPAPLACE